LYRNHPEVQAFLERGGTLVVPTRQRAAAIALAYTAAQLQRGAATWDTPDVIHWSAWQGRRLERARNPRAGAVRRLATVEEWYLWKEALDHPDAAHGLLEPDSLLQDLLRADELLEAWGLASASQGAEGALLGKLRQRVANRRRTLQVAERVVWRQVRPEDGEEIWCLGIDEIGRADRRALESLGVRIGAAGALTAGDTVPGGGLRLVAADDPDAEVRLVGDWCRAHLLRDPRARLLVMVPSRSQYDPLLRTALSERLDGDAINGVTAAESLFAIEGGMPLLEFPLVAAARSWLRAVCGRLEFWEYAALLRSSYLDAGGVEARTRLELWLRQQQITTLEAKDVVRLGSLALADLGTEPTEPLAILARLQGSRGGRQLPAV